MINKNNKYSKKEFNEKLKKIKSNSKLIFNTKFNFKKNLIRALSFSIFIFILIKYIVYKNDPIDLTKIIIYFIIFFTLTFIIIITSISNSSFLIYDKYIINYKKRMIFLIEDIVSIEFKPIYNIKRNEIINHYIKINLSEDNFFIFKLDRIEAYITYLVFKKNFNDIKIKDENKFLEILNYDISTFDLFLFEIEKKFNLIEGNNYFNYKFNYLNKYNNYNLNDVDNKINYLAKKYKKKEFGN